MKTMRIPTYLSKLTLFLVLAVVAISCDNSVSSEEEHSDAEGFRLVLNGQTIVQQLPDSTLSGEIMLTPGQETDLITVYFIDHDGNQFQPDEPEYSLGYRFSTDGVAEFEQHSEDGKWSFHIHAGNAAGDTDLSLMLMHNDHSDFTTQSIHVHVE